MLKPLTKAKHENVQIQIENEYHVRTVLQYTRYFDKILDIVPGQLDT